MNKCENQSQVVWKSFCVLTGVTLFD